jgi:Family of unknown function (DUF6519)
MKADISRDTFQATRDIRRVIAQQGRPWLDADWNEQVSVLLHRLETLAADILGDHAAVDTGFLIEPYKDKSNNPKPKMFAVLRGRYYVHGLMCENDKGWVSPAQEEFELKKPYLVYLHAWEDYDSGVEDPAISEPALRGVDPSGRTRVRWRIGWEKATDAAKAWEDFRKGLDAPPAVLKIRVKAGAVSQDPCRLDGRAAYRGLENTLYRIEVYETKPGEVQLKWARNNASTLVEVSKIGSGLRCRRPADLDASFDARGWVEVHHGPDKDPYGGGRLHRITVLNRDTGEIDLAPPAEGDGPLFIRPWAGLLEVKSGWLPLDQGLEINLDTTRPDPSKKGELRAGQYWLIPVRTEGGGQVYWPTDRPGLPCEWTPLDSELSKARGAIPEEPDLASHDTLRKDAPYIRNHYYGPLAVITFNENGLLDKTSGIQDLRKQVPR